MDNILWETLDVKITELSVTLIYLKIEDIWHWNFGVFSFFLDINVSAKMQNNMAVKIWARESVVASVYFFIVVLIFTEK